MTYDLGDEVLEAIRKNPGKTSTQYKRLLPHIAGGTVTAECSGAARYRFAERKNGKYLPTSKMGAMSVWEKKARETMNAMSSSTQERFMYGYLARLEDFEAASPEEKKNVAYKFFMELKVIAEGEM